MCRRTVRRRYDRDRDDHRHRCRAPAWPRPTARPLEQARRALADAVVLLALPRVALAAGLRRGRRRRGPGRLRGPPGQALPRPGRPAGATAPTRSAARSRRTARRCGCATRRLDVDAAARGGPRGDAGLARRRPEARAAVCVEIIDRINARSFEIANAVMHTSGQPFVMAFQAGGPHAQDRALEAVVGRAAEQERVPASVRLGEAGPRATPLRMQKDYRIVPPRRRPGHRLQHVPDVERLPRPVRLAGHRQRRRRQAAPAGGAAARDHASRSPRRCCRTTVSTRTWSAGAPRPTGEGLAKTLAERPEVAIIDYTGGPAFGGWLEERGRGRGKLVYTEKAGVNTIVVDSTDDLRGVLANLAFSLHALLRPDVHDPAERLRPARRHRRPTRASCPSTSSARGWPRRSAGSPATTPRPSSCSARRSTTACAPTGRVAARPGRGGRRHGRARLPRGRPTRRTPTRSSARPGLVALDVAREDGLHAGVLRPGRLPHRDGRHRPVAASFRDTVREHGAMTAAVYSTSEDVLDAARDAAADAGSRCRRTSPARCSSTRPRRSATSTAPAPTRRPTRPTSTPPSSPTGSAWSPPAATSDPRSPHLLPPTGRTSLPEFGHPVSRFGHCGASGRGWLSR